MQNTAVATTNDRFKPVDRKPAGSSMHDFLLEPLPVPDATESNTDTAWGLWEHSVQASDASDVGPGDQEEDDFADTIPSDFTPFR